MILMVAGDRIFAIVVGALMLTSVAGFAMMNVYEEPPKVEIPTIINTPIGPSDRVQILRTGRALIEYLYPEDCTDCSEKKALYESFVTQFDGYAVLEIAEVPANETLDRIIGMNGDTVELSGVSSQGELMETFCSVAIIQPRECLLMDI